MIEIAVCDDEEVIRRQLAELIAGEISDCHIETYASGEELLASKQHFDILFLDIQMEGRNGIEIADHLRRRKEEAVLIFVTGLRDYVFDAFDVSAFHYLLKPISERKLAEVLARAVEEVKRRGREGENLLFIQTRNRSLTLNPKEVLYVESRAKKVAIHTVKETIEFYASMRRLEGELGSNFYRCHRGYLVNMAYIAEYRTDTIRMGNGDMVWLAKEKYPEFVRAYMHYLRKGGAAHV